MRNSIFTSLILLLGFFCEETNSAESELENIRDNCTRGWVVLGYTLGKDGKAKDIYVNESYPPNYYETNAIDLLNSKTFIKGQERINMRFKIIFRYNPKTKQSCENT